MAILRRRVREWVARLVLLALGLTLSLVLVEVGLAAARIAPLEDLYGLPYGTAAHTTFGWSYPPNSRFTYSTPWANFNTPSKINSHGLRDREYPYEKAPGAHRILIVGDSFTASLEVPLDQVWHEVLEGALRGSGARAPRTEVIGAGVQGWGTGQELLYYRHEGYRYGPDVVILQFWVNDLWDNDLDMAGSAKQRWQDKQPYFVLAGSGLELRGFPADPSRLLRPRDASLKARARSLLQNHLRTYRLGRGIVLARAQRGVNTACLGSSKELQVYAPAHPPEFQRAWELTSRLIKQLKTDVTLHGREFGVVFIPTDVQVHPERWQAAVDCEPAARELHLDLDHPNRFLGEVLKRECIAYVDLTPGLRSHVESTGKPVHLEKDGHLNPGGHAVAAKLIADWLTRERFLRDKPSTETRSTACVSP